MEVDCDECSGTDLNDTLTVYSNDPEAESVSIHVDCPAESFCGDGSCDPDEDPCNCPGDCPGCCVAADCDDGNPCTFDECPAFVCAYPPKDDGTPCPDEFFCNGPVACVSGECVAGPDPCNDGVTCTVDSCFEGTDTCANLPNDAVCNDGFFCNGVEMCHVLLGCVAGVPPCAADEWCDEASQGCIVHGNGQFVGVDVDLEDFAAFQRCFGEVEDPECYPGNMVGAGSVINLNDFAVFIERFTGPQP